MFSVISHGVSYIDCASPNHERVKKSPNSCGRGRVREVCFKEGSGVALMGTESATVLWSRDVSGRIKENEGVCASLQKSLCDSTQLHGRRFLPHSFLYSDKGTAAAMLYWQLQTKEVILPGNGLFNTETTVS